MAYYWTCPHCGANLDPGERCDCLKELKKSKKDNFLLARKKATPHNEQAAQKIFTK